MSHPSCVVHPLETAQQVKLYFACSITGGREFEHVYQALIEALVADGHEIPTAHLADTTVVELERVSPREVYARDVTWISESDALLAECQRPSHGVGYEIGYALEAGKPVLCISQQGRKVSKMITGNPHASLTTQTYRYRRGRPFARDLFVY
jgi:nucleoside 2-deoxyribosyltransferase